ncbi:MAG: hypothetical protein MJD61_15620 [Proteobacteria bacterium]|nr:hypothetical protein [Pseudomonadota bacterium]
MCTKKLPLEGALVEEISLHGNGKDSEFRMTTKDPSRQVRFDMSYPRLTVEVEGSVSIESFNWGDIDLGIRYRPLEDLRVASFELVFPGEEDEWKAVFADHFEAARPDLVGWVFSVARVVLRRGRPRD